MSRILGTLHLEAPLGISMPVFSVNIDSQQALGNSQSQMGYWSGWGAGNLWG